MTSNSARILLRRGLAAAGQSTTGGLPSAVSMSMPVRARTMSKVPLSPSIQQQQQQQQQQLQQQLLLLQVAKRFFGSPANAAAADVVSSPVVAEAVAHKYENLVEESIKKLMTSNDNHRESRNKSKNKNKTKNSRHEVEQMKPISNQDLEERLRYFQVRTAVRSWFLFFHGKEPASERINE